jgi:hypothetical protein
MGKTQAQDVDAWRGTLIESFQGCVQAMFTQTGLDQVRCVYMYVYSYMHVRARQTDVYTPTIIDQNQYQNREKVAWKIS